MVDDWFDVFSRFPFQFGRFDKVRFGKVRIGVMVASQSRYHRPMNAPILLPFLSSGIPPTGGLVKQSPADFRVEELPAYIAQGSGDHVLAVIRKTGISTFEAVRRLSSALNIKPADIGTAGLKDAQAITIQQISLPPPITVAAVTALTVDGIEILSAGRHGNKLRTGHLRGNRFVICIRNTLVDEETAAVHASSVLTALQQMPGTPNWFGNQRFGKDGNNAQRGHELVTGKFTGKKPNGRVKRLLLSSLQSKLFNDYLARRINDHLYAEVIEGDVLKKTDTGGVFVTEATQIEASRMARGEVVVTGPMFGPKMTRPPGQTAAQARENAVLDAAGLNDATFSHFAKLTPGTRRPLAVQLGETHVQVVDKHAIEVSFTLPRGSYATCVIREITKLAA